jgi:pimeloyl-ACP methyl ester carboxylesterase
MVALEFALAQPNRLQGLVLVGSSINGYEPISPQPAQWDEARQAFERGDYEQVVELAVQVFADGRGRVKEQVPQSLREYVRTHYRRSLQEQHDQSKVQWLNPPAARRLPEITAPTRLIVGSFDTEQIVEMAAVLAKRMPHAHQIILEGTAHLPCMEFPDKFNDLLQEFLYQLS